MTPESKLLAEIRLACSRDNVRLFRQNSGMAWTGDIIQRSAQTITLKDYRPFRSGFEGLADLTGWVTRGDVAVFVAMELKAGRRQATEDQARFLEAVRKAGGVAGVARTVAEAVALLR
jgi:hypothetical protein